MSHLSLLPGAAALALGVGLGLAERAVLDRRLSRIRHRITVTGTRGKSTVTRLVLGALHENGTLAMGKTTGSEPRLLGFNRGPGGEITSFETALARRPEGPNINEVRRLVKEAAARGAEALVAECMAVEPSYQEALSRHFLRANVTVIVNVLPDHLDVLPTLEAAAASFARTIPEKGLLVTVPGDFLPYFKKAARRRQAELLVADTAELPRGYTARFPYLVFPETLALALTTAMALGIKKETALRGMLKARPDPGVLLLQRISSAAGLPAAGVLIKAFAANDSASTLKIWNHFREKGLVNERTVVLMNCRGDRVERSGEFARNALPFMPADSLWVMGEVTGPVLARARQLPYREVLDLGGLCAAEVRRRLRERCSGGTVFFGAGNYGGLARELCLALEEDDQRGGEAKWLATK